MKWLLIFVSLFYFSIGVDAQRLNIDSLRFILTKSTSDTERALIIAELGRAYSFLHVDSGLSYSQEAITFSRNIHFVRGEANGLSNYGWNLSIFGNYPLGIEYAFKALRLYETLEDKNEIGYTYSVLNFNFRELGDFPRAILYGHKAIALLGTLNNTRLTFLGSYKKISLAVLGETYERSNQLDSAYYYTRKAYDLDASENAGRWNVPTFVLANIYFKKKQYDSAIFSYKLARHFAQYNNIKKDIIDISNSIARFFFTTGKVDSAIVYGQGALSLSKDLYYNKGMMEATSTISDVYLKKRLNDSSIKYLLIRDAYKDSLFNQEKERQIQAMVFGEQIKEQQIAEISKEMKRQKTQTIVVIAIIFLIAALITYARIYFLKQQVRVEKMRNQISHDLHDDIGSALGSINIISQLIQEKVVSDGDGIAGELPLLQKISRTAQGTMEAMDDIVWTINPYKDTWEELLIRIKEFAYPLAEARGIQFYFTVDVEDEKKVSMVIRKSVFLIFKEAFINALKYADTKQIMASISVKNHFLTLIIEDKGQGFDLQKETNRNGLKNMYERAKGLNGQLNIRSVHREGTTIQLTCPTV